MASEVTIETRTISGTGIIRIPTDGANKRTYTLYAQVVRPPRSPYLNLKSNPPEGFFSRITCVKSDTVFKNFDHIFPQQAWVINPDLTSQTLIALKCAYDGLLQTFVNLGLALNLAPYVVGNTIEDYKQLGIEFSEFRVVCYADTAIKFTLMGLELDICKGEYEEPQSPTPPPTPPTQVSPGTPLLISPPYSNDTISKKAPIDEDFVPPPVGINCVQYNILYSYTQQNAVVAQQTNRVFGPIGRIRRFSVSGTNGVQLECRGIGGGNRTCQSFAFYTLTSGPAPNDYINPALISFSPA